MKLFWFQAEEVQMQNLSLYGTTGGQPGGGGGGNHLVIFFTWTESKSKVHTVIPRLTTHSVIVSGLLIK